jgi:hypothetical protein
MNKLFLSLAIFLILFFKLTSNASAEVYVAGASAGLKQSTNFSSDSRVTTLRKFLKGHQSPLTDYADELVAASDKYGLDWRLVAAISGVESTFGKKIPRGSYNAYGWANGDYRFKSWEDSIEIVSQTLRTKYIDKGAPTINKIGRRYAPPSTTWARNVKFFMYKIESFPLAFDFEG